MTNGGGNVALQSSPSDNQVNQMDWNIMTPIHGSEYWVVQMKQKLKFMEK